MDNTTPTTADDTVAAAPAVDTVPPDPIPPVAAPALHLSILQEMDARAAYFGGVVEENFKALIEALRKVL